jgi:hypothetical protein
MLPLARHSEMDFLPITMPKAIFTDKRLSS